MGNGISLIIFAGIVADLPRSFVTTFFTYKSNQIFNIISFLVLALLMIVAVVFVTEGERRIPVSYAKHVRGTKMYGGVTTQLPLKVNQAGVIPIIFAISVLMLPSFIGQLLVATKYAAALQIGTFLVNLFQNQIVYSAVYFLLVFFFTFFYTSITFEPKEISENLQKMGGFIPGYRPGEKTAEYLSQISSRITLFGALFLALIAILPMILEGVTKVNTFNLGGTSILILVAVAIEIKREIEAQITMRKYDY